MFDKFKIMEPLFEDQVHQCHRFSLRIDDEEYNGIVKAEEIIWYHPQPNNVLSEHHVKSIERKVLEIAPQQIQ